MRYMGLLKSDPGSEAGEMPDPGLIQRMGTFMEEVTAAGVILASDGLKPTSEGKRVRLANGTVSVIDGPFTESKELIASYALFQVQSWDEAIYWTTRFLEVLGQGEVELRPLYEATDFPEDIFTREEAAREEAFRAQMEANAARA